jgi:hypothetical protein
LFPAFSLPRQHVPIIGDYDRCVTKQIPSYVKKSGARKKSKKLDFIGFVYLLKPAAQNRQHLSQRF